MTDAASPPQPDAPSPQRLDPLRATLVYSMYHHLGDFAVMAGLLKKFDQLGAGFQSLVAHSHSPHVALFEGEREGRFFDITRAAGFVALVGALRRRRREGQVVFGVPMAPGSVQAFAFFWMLKKLGGLDYIVDFNLINADVLTPPRRRYIFERHLAQAAEIFKRPEWLADVSMPLALALPAPAGPVPARRIGFFPWSGRSRLPEFQWPEERWAELARRLLAEFPGEIVLLGRDDDFPRFEQALRAQLPPGVRDRFIGRPAASVAALAADLRDLAGLVTLNTSALHLAHALRIRLVALCGSSGEFWLPEGDHVRLVRDGQGILPPSDKGYHDPRQPSLQRIGVDEVHAACRDHFRLAAATP